MNVLTLSDDPVYNQPASVTQLGEDRWVAHLQLGQFGTQHLVISAEGPSEYLAIQRLVKKCDAWSVLMSLQITEALAPRLVQIETDATKELMRSVGLDTHSTKKSEPS